MRKDVQQFYDNYGWKLKRECGEYQNDLVHGDLSQVAKEYDQACEARYLKYFDDGGRLFLDAGCGAKPVGQLGQKFERHMCVDISLVGLQEARQKLGARGLYVVADLAALPFHDDAFDAVVASYCLYHLNKDSQISAVKEFHRVARRGKNIVVFYVSKAGLIFMAHKLGKALTKIPQLFSRRRSVQDSGEGRSSPFLYFTALYPFQLCKGLGAVDITCSRTLTRVESLILHKLGLLRRATRAASFLETKFPHAMVWVGSNAAIRIQKK